METPNPIEERIVVDQLQAHGNCTERALASQGLEGWCPADFDGISCWPPTQQEHTAVQNCPPAFSQASVSRFCGEGGVWDLGQSLSYSPCGLVQEHIAAMRRLYGYLRTPGAPVPSKWYFHHRHAECLDRMNNTLPPTTKQLDAGLPSCPMLFDGWSCWDYTLAGDTAFVPCPKYITGFDPTRFAFRACTENGSWFQHPDTGRPWSNYTTCVDVEDLQFRQLVNTLYIAGYSISFLALALSLLIFICFRSLKCTRIAIHIHLFLSFALNNLMWIIWYRYVVGDLQIVENNETWCQALHVLLQYLMVANYAWMFCEGLHLHLALVVVFVKDDVVMRWFYFVGWVLPGLLAAIYATVRVNFSGETERCWMEDSHSKWLLTAPVLLSMLANVVFLVNVVRVLLTKLHPRSSSPAPRGMRKAVRATLILVPLFGIHHILIPFRPEPRASGEMLYQLFSAVVVSLQGFCVACLFCFANVDVHGALRNMVRRLCRPRSGHQSTTAGCAMLANTQTHTNTREACVGL